MVYANFIPHAPRSRGVFVVLFCTLLIQQFLPDPIQAHWWTVVRDSLHVPMFVIVTLLLWQLFPRLEHPAKTVWVVVLAVAVGVGTELIQFFTKGTPSLGDFGFDLVGIAVALGLLFGQQRSNWLMAGTVAVVGLLVAAVLPLNTARQYLHYQGLLPAVTDFSGPWPLAFLSCRGQCRVAAAPAGWPQSAGKIALEITFEQSMWPGLNRQEVPSDLLSCQTLEYDLFVPGPTPLLIFVGVSHPQQRKLRKFKQQLLPPGPHRLEFELEPVHAYGDSSDLVNIALFTNQAGAGRQLWVGSVKVRC